MGFTTKKSSKSQWRSSCRTSFHQARRRVGARVTSGSREIVRRTVNNPLNRCVERRPQSALGLQYSSPDLRSGDRWHSAVCSFDSIRAKYLQFQISAVARDRLAKPSRFKGKVLAQRRLRTRSRVLRIGSYRHPAWPALWSEETSS